MGLEALSPRRRARDVRRVRPRRAAARSTRTSTSCKLRGDGALPGRRPRARPGAPHVRPRPLRPAVRLRPRRASRRTSRSLLTDGRRARLGDLGPRAEPPEVPGLAAAHFPQVRLRTAYAVRDSDHRHLPRHLRPRHERARRRDHARGPDLRPRRRRRRRQPAPQDADVRGRASASSSSRTRSAASSRTSRSTSSASSSSTSPAAGTPR